MSPPIALLQTLLHSRLAPLMNICLGIPRLVGTYRYLPIDKLRYRFKIFRSELLSHLNMVEGVSYGARGDIMNVSLSKDSDEDYDTVPPMCFRQRDACL